LKHWFYKLLLPFAILQVIVIIGVVGYMLIEDYTFLQALYMTTLAITTVGYGEVKPLSANGQLFTTFLLIASWSALTFVLATITQFVISIEIQKLFKLRRMNTKIKKLSNHVILCGFGRNGQQAAKTLKAHNIPFVVIEKEGQLFEKFAAENFEVLYIVGNATEDECLIQANIMEAKSLLTTLPLDAENVFIVLSARSINSQFQIISRASDNNSTSKLKKAGADSVIMPDKIGGTHMATLVSKPDVIEFIDYLSGEEGESIHVEAVDFDDLPPEIQNKTLTEIMLWKKTGVNNIGIKSLEGKFIINPPSETIITKGMKLMILGDRKQIDAMKNHLSNY
jgi:voltage-gated potassium channel